MLRARRVFPVLVTLAGSSRAMSMVTTKVNVLDLAAACVACTESASSLIQKIADDAQTDSQKNTRLKADGSFVTDADFAAQGVIVQAIRSVSADIKIIGEESAEEMAAHIGQHAFLDHAVLERTKQELRLRYFGKEPTKLPLAEGTSAKEDIPEEVNELLSGLEDPESCVVDTSRISIIVDPLDGTKSYAFGEYEVVSILIAIMLDNEPFFGVIGKPFGYLKASGLTNLLDTPCVTLYGGPLLKGVYCAGGKQLHAPKPGGVPRAVISSSRSKGVVHDFCVHLGEQNLIHKTPILVSGAGEKSLRLILSQNNESIWFFPKPGTSRWDVAAPDAMLRSLGGILTNKFGNELDYSKERTEAENTEGIVACIDKELHAKCIALFQQGDWLDRR